MDVNWIGLVVLSRAHTKGPPSYGGVCKGYPSYTHLRQGVPLQFTLRMKVELEVELAFCSIQIGRKLVTVRSILQKQSSKQAMYMLDQSHNQIVHSMD